MVDDGRIQQIERGRVEVWANTDHIHIVNIADVYNGHNNWWCLRPWSQHDTGGRLRPGGGGGPT